MKKYESLETNERKRHVRHEVIVVVTKLRCYGMSLRTPKHGYIPHEHSPNAG